MKLYSKFINRLLSSGLTLLLLFAVLTTNAQVSLTTGTYSQDFSTLASSGTSSTVPAGWAFVESGSSANNNGLYTANNGSATAGDVYSLGATAASERAFGGLQSGTLIPTVGASFTNNSSGTINSLIINYTGEQWRLGTVSRLDRLEFQYSLNATSLTTGTWTGVTALNFVAPNTGPTAGTLDGNAAANKTAIASTITGLNITNLSTFFIRWVDFDASGAEDILGVDDFSISFTTASVVPLITSFSPASSCSEFGTPVVINGSNFAGVNSVTFNGTPVPLASIVINGAGTQITVPLPNGATTGPIVVSNGTNSAMSALNFVVNPIPAATLVSGGGTFCGNTTITASGGTGGSIYFQGTLSGGTIAGIPSSSEIISSSGTYYFRAQSAPGCWGPEGSTSVVINSAATPVSIFTESIGNVGATTTIASHEAANGFDNDGFTMSGTGDIRFTLPSSGYTGASGLANVFLTTSATNFQIANINTTVYQQFTLSFGINKSTTAGDGSDLIVEVSSDGSSYTALTFPALPTGPGTAIWHFRTASGTIPSTANLRIRFRNTSAATLYRIDDISLIGSNPSSTITASGPTTFCPGGSVVLSAPNATSYLWSNNATTQNITVTTAGNYSCQLTMPNGCVLTSNSITVALNEAPSFTVCPSNITDFAPSNSCAKQVNYNVTVTGSPVPVLSYNFSGATPGSGSGTGSGSFFNVGTTTVIINAANVCGPALCTFDVIIFDITPPTAICQSATVILDASGNGTLAASQINNGSTDNCTIASVVVNPNTFNCSNVTAAPPTPSIWINEIHYDNAGNDANEFVELAGTAGINLANYSLVRYNGSAPAAAVTYATPAQLTTLTGTIPNQSNGYGTFAVLFAMDGLQNGNNDGIALVNTLTNTVVQFLSYEGVITASNGPAAGQTSVDIGVSESTTTPVGSSLRLIGSGTSYASFTWAPEASASSGAVNQGQTFTAPAGGNLVTLTVTDVNGLSSTCTAIVSVSDVTPPTANCQSITVQLDANGTASITAAQINNNSTDACGIASYAVTPNTFTCAMVGPNLVTLTVTDVNGNSSTCTSTVTVEDVTPPVANCQNLTIQLDATGNASITASQINNGSSDICGMNPSMSVSPNTFTCADISGDPVGDLIISEYIEGNVLSNKYIEIYNGTSGNINLSNYRLRLYSNGNTAPGPGNDVLLSGILNAGQTIVYQNSAATFYTGPATNNTAVNFNGDDAVALFKISSGTNVDIIGRIGQDPGNAWTSGSLSTENQTLRRKSTVTQGVTTNPASGFPTLATEWDSFAPGDVTGLGSHLINGGNLVTLTVADVNGNSSTCTAYVTVQDVTNPVITVCAPDQNVNLNACQLTVPDLVAQTTATDNCAGSVVVSQSPIAGTVLPSSHNQTHSILITATDAAGNIITCNTILTGKDVTNPTLSCPGNITVSNTPGICGANVTYSAPTGSDNCTYTITQTNGNASGSVFPIGTTVNTFVATDAAGNSTSCSFSVVVNDTQAPYLAPGSSCPNSFTGCNPVTWVAPIFIDNCPGVQTISNHSPGSQFPVGTTTVTYTATDLKGNPSTCTFTVTVLDTSEAATSITSNRDFNNICSGGDITLTVNGGHLGLVSVGVPAQWKWYRNGCGSPSGVLVGTGPSLTVAPTTTTTYYVRPEGACNTPACVSITVIVSTGNPTGSPVFSSVPTQGAPGVTDVISVAPVPGATFYQWSTINGHINSVLFNGNISPELTSVPTVNVTFVLPQQNYQIRVLAGNACGRTGQANTHIRGTVSAPTSMTGPTQVCPGSPVTYSIQAIPPVSGNTGVTYNWSLIPTSAGTITMAPNGLSATVNFASGFGSAQVCANGVSSFGLPGSPYCLNVTSSAPVPGVISGQQSPCINNAYQYSIASVPGASTYIWSTNIGVVQSVAVDGLSAVILFPNASFTNKSVCVSASSLCGTSAPSCLTINSGTPGDPGDINGTAHGVCGASGVNYYLNTSDANSYLWTVTANMDIPGVATNNSVSVDFLPGFTSGIVTVTAFYNCGQVVKHFDVEGSPVPPIILPTAVCPNSTQIFFVSNIDATATYTWTINGDIIDDYCTGGNCTQYYIETGNGGGTFEVIPSNNCGVGDPVFSEVCRMAAPKTEIDIYPNPTTGKLTLEFNSKNSGQYNVKVTDLSGRAVMMTDLKAVAGRNKHEIDLSNTNAGVYMIYIKDSNSNFIVQKIVIE